MTTFYEIPLSGTPQHFSIVLSGVTYQLLFRYRDAPMGGWVVDFFTSAGDRILCGVPLVTGSDLLGQYAYLNFNATLMVISDGDPDAVPTFNNLGSEAHVLWVTEP